MIEKSKVACFSGQRILPKDCTEIQSALESAITKLIEQGVIFFGAGGALGFDMLAEETILKLKQKHPQIRCGYCRLNIPKVVCLTATDIW